MSSPGNFSMASSSSLSVASSPIMYQDDIISRIRSKLNVGKVKLWLPPYTTQAGERGEETQTLAERYSTELELDTDTVAATLEELRQHALEKLAAKKKYQERGLASLKVKLTGNIPMQVLERTVNVEVTLSVSGQDLKQQICQQSGVRGDMLKLICSGRVIDDFLSLASQNIKHGSCVMAICLTETEHDARQQQQLARRFQDTREAAHLLSNNDEVDDNSKYYLQIADQNGKPLDLPKVERKALVFAMTLHEKGRAAVKRKEYGEALLLLLEADSEFKKCRADILKAVDNYALVCLDVVWCYLCLRNVTDLPDAQHRLETCDDCFRRSYGPNLERLALVKGGTGTEKALFLRLHLLQGILAFHQLRMDDARQLFDRAENELRSLQIDDSLISQVMDMGFSSQEARLGLRLTEGNVPLAVAHIMSRRQEKQDIREMEKEKQRRRKIARKLGDTAGGEAVNVEYYESLVSMGFPKGAAAEALKQTNNEITSALEVLSTRPELLSLPDPEAEPFTVTDKMVAQVMSMGFGAEVARAALQHLQSVERAAEELLARQGSVPQAWLDALMSEAEAESSGQQDGPSGGKSREEKAREKLLIAAVIEDLPDNEEDHLDISLREEEQFLMEYKAFLFSKAATPST